MMLSFSLDVPDNINRVVFVHDGWVLTAERVNATAGLHVPVAPQVLPVSEPAPVKPPKSLLPQTRGYSHSVRWSEEERQTLMKHAQNGLYDDEIAVAMGRTVKAIGLEANKLKIGLRRRYRRRTHDSD